MQRRWHAETPGTRKQKTIISGDELRELITVQLRGKLDNSFMLYIADDSYYCPPIKDVKKIVKASALDRKTWVEERFDCDDFAVCLKAHFAEASYKDGQRRVAHCCGVVWGMLPEAHAINWVVTDDGKLRFIEPQTDKVYLPKRTDHGIWFMLA